MKSQIYILITLLVVAENKLLTLEFGLREDALARNLRRLNRRAVGEEGSGSVLDEAEGSASGSGALEEVASGFPDDNEKDTESGCSGEDGSGDGSGCGPVPVVTTRKPTTKLPTKASPSATIVDINTAVKVKTTSPPPSTSAPATTMGNDINPVVPTQDPNNTVGAIKGGPSDDEAGSGVDFTSGIIIGVVVGAILAILIILFLVYRIRKKDSGSYILDEKSSQAMLQEEDQKEHGKEYFA